MAIERRRVPLHRLRDLIPAGGGTTSYRTAGAPRAPLALSDDDANELLERAADSATGSVMFTSDTATLLVLPPFPVEHDRDLHSVDPAELLDLLERRRSIAVFLLRLGGFSVGFFRGEALVDSRTGQRFVKGRHRAGGQSQRRFERIREKQVHELFKKACTAAAEKLAPYEGEIEHVFFGGDRRTLAAFHKRCDYFERYGVRIMSRVLPVAGDPRHATLEAVPREVWSSDIFIARAHGPEDRA
jgi:hypothetical protein